MPLKNAKLTAVPETFQRFTRRFRGIADAHESIAQLVDHSGPLDRKSCELIKLGISIGAGLMTATKCHARRARQEGASLAEIELAILPAVNTSGFPRTVAAWQWAREAVDRR